MAPSTTSTETVPAPKTQEHRSGDPTLAFGRDEQSLPPKFGDKLEERKFLKHRLALAYRVFAKFGFSEGVAGHITVRDPVDPTSFWVNPYGKYPAITAGSYGNDIEMLTLSLKACISLSSPTMI